MSFYTIIVFKSITSTHSESPRGHFLLSACIFILKKLKQKQSTILSYKHHFWSFFTPEEPRFSLVSLSFSLKNFLLHFLQGKFADDKCSYFLIHLKICFYFTFILLMHSITPNFSFLYNLILSVYFYHKKYNSKISGSYFLNLFRDLVVISRKV